MEVSETLYWPLANVKVLSIVLVSALLFTFFSKLYQKRKVFSELQKQGLPVAPGWNWATGNLLLLTRLGHVVPRRAAHILMFTEIVRKFPETGACYVDLWPFGRPLLLIVNPTLAAEACQTQTLLSTNRPVELDLFFNPIAGGPSLFDLPDVEWRRWRTVFNKGFSDSTVSAMVPAMVEAADSYRRILAKKAEEDGMFQIDPITLRFALDFIGKIALNHDMKCQEGYNVLADSMLLQIKWLSKTNGVNQLESLNFVRKAVQKWNSYRMDKYIGKIIDARFHEYINAESASFSASVATRSITDLVLQAYLSEAQQLAIQRGEKFILKSTKLDPAFRTFAAHQIRLFLFAGHDSMSSTICYALYLLSSNPATLARLRAEHDSILGTDLDNLVSLLSTKPNTINSLPYTAAVLKETLRLYPPGSATRRGHPDISLTSDDGTRYPTDDCIVWIVHTACQRAPQYWPRADDFLPERFLVEPGHELYPVKNVWRPFEAGPRNCIGQNLAMTELKITLAMLVRVFDFEHAYEEWDGLYPSKELNEYRGDRAFGVEEGSSHPADFMPCRMKLTESGRRMRDAGLL